MRRAVNWASGKSGVMRRRAKAIAAICLTALLLAACGGSTSVGEPAPDAGAQLRTAATPTALPAGIIDAADAENRLLTNIYARSSDSVVNIEATILDETRRGSGFVYDRQGHVITNAHLVKDADALTVTLRKAYALPAALIGLDSFSDLAVLKVSASEDLLKPLRIGQSATALVGQRAISIGNPFGLKASMTSGIVSGLGRSLPSAELIEAGAAGFDNPSIIQIDAPIHPGNSGGPLLDSQGMVIGITTAMQSDSGRFQGIGFAVPADTMRRVIPDLIAQGRVDYAWMGISVMPEDGGFGVAGLSEILDLPVRRGALLRGVAEGSPAHQAGLRGGTTPVEARGKIVCAGGDIIVAINDYYFDDLDGLITYLVQNTRPGDEVELVVVRERQAQDFSLRLRGRPAREAPAIDCETKQ